MEIRRGVGTERRRLRPALALVAALGWLTGMVPATAGSSPGDDEVVLRVYDATGERIGWTAFRALQGNGHGPDAARAAGLHVVGGLVDSSDMTRVPLDDFRARVVSYVATLAGVEAWEVGNEVNGDWLGPDVVAKVSFAAEWVKSHTAARTLLTLSWDLGADDGGHSTFSWARAYLDEALLRNELRSTLAAVQARAVGRSAVEAHSSGPVGPMIS